MRGRWEPLDIAPTRRPRRLPRRHRVALPRRAARPLGHDLRQPRRRPPKVGHRARPRWPLRPPLPPDCSTYRRPANGDAPRRPRHSEPQEEPDDRDRPPSGQVPPRRLCSARSSYLLLCPHGPTRRSVLRGGRSPSWGFSEPTHLAPGRPWRSAGRPVRRSTPAPASRKGRAAPITTPTTLPGTGLSLSGRWVVGAKGGFPSGAPMTCTSSPDGPPARRANRSSPATSSKMAIEVWTWPPTRRRRLSDLVTVEGGGAVDGLGRGPAHRQPGPRPLLASRRARRSTVRRASAAGAPPGTSPPPSSLATSAVGVAAGAPKGVSFSTCRRGLGRRPPRASQPAGFSRPRHRNLTRIEETVPSVAPSPPSRARPSEPGTTDLAAPIVNVEPAPGEAAALAFAFSPAMRRFAPRSRLRALEPATQPARKGGRLPRRRSAAPLDRTSPSWECPPT